MLLFSLLHFAAIIDGVEYPASATPLVFEPILAGAGPVPTLLGFVPPEIPEIPVGTRVLVPRLAAAVQWAQERGLVPVTMPLSAMGQRGGSGPVVITAVEDAPAYLPFDFPKAALSEGYDFPCYPGEPAPQAIQRGLGGPHTVTTDRGWEFPAVPVAAVSRPDGSAVLPDLEEGKSAIILPQDGAIIRAFEAAHPGVAILVTGVLDPVTKRVPLYRVR